MDLKRLMALSLTPSKEPTAKGVIPPSSLRRLTRTPSPSAGGATRGEAVVAAEGVAQAWPSWRRKRSYELVGVVLLVHVSSPPIGGRAMFALEMGSIIGSVPR